jgi:hypothetical protein
LIETDRQGSLLNWQSRRGLAEPIVEAVYDAKNVEQRLQALERGGVTLTPFAFVLNQIPPRGGHRVSNATSVLESESSA